MKDFSVSEEVWFGDRPEGPARSAAAESMAALVARVHGLKPLSSAVTRLASLTSHDDLDVQQVAAIVQEDASLAGSVLRVVNSASGVRTPCTSIAHAVALLGARHLRDLAVTVAIFGMLDVHGDRAKSVHAHAHTVAALAQRLAPCAGVSPDDAFTCGLMHDVGKLMLLQCDEGPYAKLLDEVGDARDALHLREMELLGFDHAVLAAFVLDAWKLPSLVTDVVRLHHDPARAYAVGVPVAKLVHVVRLADAIADKAVAEARPADAWFDEVARGESATYLAIDANMLRGMWRWLHGAANAHEDGEHHAMAAPEPEPPCVVCGAASNADKCPCCGGELCPRHTNGTHWCALCEQAYRASSGRLARGAFFAAACLVVFGLAAFFMAGSQMHAAASELATGLFALAATAFAVGVVARRQSRADFRRRAPSRGSAAVVHAPS